MCFLIRSDESRYGDLIEDLKKGVLRERDEYPTTVIAAYELLMRTSEQVGVVQRRTPRQSSRFRNGRNNFSFAQSGNQPRTEPVVGTDGVTHSHITCYNCNNKGHYSGQCPTATGVGLAQVGFQLTQSETGGIKKSWILLDTCSTHSVSNNPKLVTGVKQCRDEDILTLSTNAGCRVFDKQAMLKFLPMSVHFDEGSMATIVSMKDVANVTGVCVHMDTDIERAIKIFYKGKVIKFKECADGLYFFDTEGHEGVQHKNNKTEILCYSALQTTRENKLQYTKQEIERANKARHY